MPIPTYDKLMLPLLQLASNGAEYHVRQAMSLLAEHFQLTEDERSELLPSGRMSTFDNRVHWAKTYLIKSGLLQSTGRGLFQITQRGYDVLDSNLEYIDRGFLDQFAEFREFQNRSKSTQSEQETATSQDEKEATPEETMDIVFRQMRSELIHNLLEYVLAASPAFFERLVVDLLLAMGYGSSLQDAGKTIGRSGDGGIDGYIQEDKLGLDMIYIQAKRWARDHTVGRPDIQGFVGSLMGIGAAKGVFITTSDFSTHAITYGQNIANVKVILINGEQLANLMIEHGVGVSVEKTYVVKKVDENYFPDYS